MRFFLLAFLNLCLGLSLCLTTVGCGDPAPQARVKSDPTRYGDNTKAIDNASRFNGNYTALEAGDVPSLVNYKDEYGRLKICDTPNIANSKDDKTLEFFVSAGFDADRNCVTQQTYAFKEKGVWTENSRGFHYEYEDATPGALKISLDLYSHIDGLIRLRYVVTENNVARSGSFLLRRL